MSLMPARRLARRLAKALLAIAAGAIIAGCSSDQFGDLRGFVETEKAKPGGRVEPIPEVKPFEAFAYRPAGRKSPFEPWGSNLGIASLPGKMTGGIHPDANRRRETLESFPLDTLRMVGTLGRKDGVWAVIKAPDGLVYRVSRNNYMGQNHGRVTRINEEKVELVEIVSDGLGGWQERPASLGLAEKSQ